jgi:hypothetical protein
MTVQTARNFGIRTLTNDELIDAWDMAKGTELIAESVKRKKIRPAARISAYAFPVVKGRVGTKRVALSGLFYLEKMVNDRGDPTNLNVAEVSCAESGSKVNGVAAPKSDNPPRFKLAHRQLVQRNDFLYTATELNELAHMYGQPPIEESVPTASNESDLDVKERRNLLKLVGVLYAMLIEHPPPRYSARLGIITEPNILGMTTAIHDFLEAKHFSSGGLSRTSLRKLKEALDVLTETTV